MDDDATLARRTDHWERLTAASVRLRALQREAWAVQQAAKKAARELAAFGTTPAEIAAAAGVTRDLVLVWLHEDRLPGAPAPLPPC